MKTYSNPVKQLTVEDYPSGGHRVKAIFTIESNKKGERVSRVTEDQNGKLCKPKVTTYAKIVRIMTGDDDRTYIVELPLFASFIHVMQSNMKYQEETIHSHDERFAGLKQLLESS